MASICSIHCQQNSSNFLHGNHPPPFDHNHNNARIAPSSVSISRDFYFSKWKRLAICSSAAAASVNSGMAIAKPTEKINHNDSSSSNNNNNKAAAAFVYEKLDKWMENSVVEIVKNLKEAPLLVHVYDKGGVGDQTTTTLKTEKSVQEENWGAVKEKWRKKESPLPEGVIFVEQLMDKEEEEEEDITRAWGVVVQGKGVECGPICYLLKTSRVDVGSGGLGLGGMSCTHYCLMRVRSFRESALSQLQNCWLIQGQ